MSSAPLATELCCKMITSCKISHHAKCVIPQLNPRAVLEKMASCGHPDGVMKRPVGNWRGGDPDRIIRKTLDPMYHLNIQQFGSSVFPVLDRDMEFSMKKFQMLILSWGYRHDIFLVFLNIHTHDIHI